MTGDPLGTPDTPGPPPSPHTDVGAYALGLLTDAEASRFEDHLAGCTRCAEELEANLGLRPLLQEVASEASFGSVPSSGSGPASGAHEGGGPLDRALAAAASERRRARRRRHALAGAVAAVLLAAGALGGVAVGPLAGDDDADRPPPTTAEAARAAFAQGEKFSDHDPSTSVEATVSLQERPWGTHVTLRIGNLTGPRACDLVAVGGDGGRQTVATWSVPGYGYGIEGTAYEEPLYVAGGAGLTPDRIDHFEVRTLEGEKLAAIRMETPADGL
ncbi:zf-HC2 domain-containing protein [Streptomyces sp. DSM 42041]|uniref:Zf-HC2 domain-containing protein n=1 Tax=Streptomyces hazeniae TaxID=3075538 RepID=A0ABU2NX92_9ACTN|nr:zf-HC2 domain-containing protein [Streptomyces sp. DSM 42041]MDT0381612.1 zf-HC2 domain-containing protein [Streptomyces sp. DSM 42041]